MNYKETLQAVTDSLDRYGNSEAVVNGFRIKIEQDSCSYNPYDDWDMLGDWYQFLNDRYTMGECMPWMYNLDCQEGLISLADNVQYPHDVDFLPREVAEKRIRAWTKRNGIELIEWTIGYVNGYTVVTPAQIRECFMCKRITADIRKRARDNVKFDIKVLRAWADGEVYWFSVEHAETGISVDSCGGFYGSDNRESGIFEAIADSLPEDEQAWYESQVLPEFAGLVGSV